MQPFEYQAINEYYEGKTTSNGIPFINHIDEGLIILDELGATDLCKRAFCLHPIFQSNEDWDRNYEESLFAGMDEWAIALAVEYRNIANFYLSTTGYNERIINLLALARPEIHDMLVADKVQNYKDLLKYNKNRSNFNQLVNYFKQWFRILKLTDETVNILMETLNEPNQRRSVRSPY